MRIDVRHWLGFALAASCVVVTRAAEGRIPIYQPSTVITQPGSYYVTQDIIGTGAAPVISVQATGVDIDLNGFTLFGAAGPAPVIRIDSNDNIRIHGGKLAGGGRSIDSVPAVGLFVTIEDVSMTNPAGAGIRLVAGGGLVIRRVQVLHAGAEGILIEDCEQVSVEDSLVSGSVASAIRLSNTNASRVLRSNIRGSLSHGIVVDGGASGASQGVQIRDNLVFSAQGDGIRADAIQGGEIWENTVHRSFSSGIHLLPSAREVSVRRNHVNSSGTGGGIGSGLLVESDQNSIEGNHLSNNFDYGLRLTSTSHRNTFGDNSISGNLAISACIGTLLLGDFCNDGANNSSFGNNLVPSLPVF